MIRILLDPLNLSLTVPFGSQLLTVLKRAKVDLPAVCNGQGTCGTCAVRVMKGQGCLTPATDQEHTTLLNTRQSPDRYRLSCQTTIVPGPAELTLLLDPKSAKKLNEILKRLENRIAPRTLCHPDTGKIIVEVGQRITRSALEQLLS